MKSTEEISEDIYLTDCESPVLIQIIRTLLINNDSHTKITGLKLFKFKT